MRCVLGFDGGGTKTDCVLMDETRTVLARTRSGPSNPSRVSLDSALAALSEAAHKALDSSGKSAADIACIHGGIAGVGAARAIPDVIRRLKAHFPNAIVTIDTDLSLTLSATREIPSVVVIAGTGSAVIGRDSPESLAHEGGLGPILGDPGSAYDIGRKAVVLGLRQFSEGQNSYLGKEILSVFHCSWIELQDRIRANAEDVLPKIFPIVASAANQGDTSARELLNEAAQDLSKLAVRVIERLGLPERSFFLAKTGGVFGRSAYLDDPFDALIHQIAPNARIGPLPQRLAEFAAGCAVGCLNSATKQVGD
jgi:N-acetylglucosamine kinase-like BadF-type ATPase